MRAKACLDTDAIIKLDQIGLLERVVSLFEICYLHKQVFLEVKWPKETQAKLQTLIEKSKVILITDRDLIELVGYQEIYLDRLRQVCEIFQFSFCEAYIHQLEGLEIDQMLQAMRAYEQYLDNLGEMKTLLMIVLLREQGKGLIHYFISDDRRARNAIVLSYGMTLQEKIKGLSVMGAFYLLKEVGMAKQEALERVDLLNTPSTKIYLKKNQAISMENELIIKELYQDHLQLMITGDLIATYT